MTKPIITIAEITAMEKEKSRVHEALAQIAREIYRLRNGQPIEAGFRFSAYLLTDFDGTHYCGMDETDWEIGTPLLSVTLFRTWPGGGDYEHITFPQAWLTDDWKRLETNRVTTIREATRVEEEEQRRRAKIACEEADRRIYERLKEKFG